MLKPGMAYTLTFRPPSAAQPDPNSGDADGQVIPADWVYDQSTGTITHYNQSFADYDAARRAATLPYTPTPNRNGVGDVYVGNYSGRGAGLNNPDAAATPNVGPLPNGGYFIGGIGTQTTGNKHHLPDAMRLTPMDSNDMHGRTGFLIHGGDFQRRGSSEGCVVAPPDVRRAIGDSDDNRLWSIPGWRGTGL